MQQDLFGDESSENRQFDIQEQYIKEREDLNFSLKVNRLKHLHKINPNGITLMGQIELVLTYREAQLCYIDGHFLSTIVLSQAFVEKIIYQFYTEIGKDKIAKRGLNAILSDAKKNRIIKEFIINKIDKIRLIRNPITHSKGVDYPHSLDNRSYKNRISPIIQIEKDAKEAIEIATFIAITDFYKLK